MTGSRARRARRLAGPGFHPASRGHGRQPSPGRAGRDGVLPGRATPTRQGFPRGRRNACRPRVPAWSSGCPPDYATAFPGEIRPLVGARDGVLLAQQTAANLGATVGSDDLDRPTRARRAPRVTVDGIVDLPAADSLFQSIGAAPGSAPDGAAGQRRPPPAPPGAGSFATARVAADVRHAAPRRSSRARLPSDPGAAFADVIGRAKNLEAALVGRPGSSATTSGAQARRRSRATRLYAQLLFLFLGVPGVIARGAARRPWSLPSGGERRRASRRCCGSAAPPRRDRPSGRVPRRSRSATAGALLGLAGARR